MFLEIKSVSSPLLPNGDYALLKSQQDKVREFNLAGFCLHTCLSYYRRDKQTFFFKGTDGKYCGLFGPHGLYCSYSALLCRVKADLDCVNERMR